MYRLASPRLVNHLRATRESNGRWKNPIEWLDTRPLCTHEGLVRPSALWINYPVMQKRFLTSNANNSENQRSKDKRSNGSASKLGSEEPHTHDENLSLPVSFPGSPGGSGGSGGGGLFSITRSPLFDAALTTFIGLGIGEPLDHCPFELLLIDSTVFLGGIAYVTWYKWNVLVKVSTLSYRQRVLLETSI